MRDFENILLDAMNKNEPSIISRYLIDVAQEFSTFYNSNKILCDNKDEQDARLYVTYMTKIVLNKWTRLYLEYEVSRKNVGADKIWYKSNVYFKYGWTFKRITKT